MDLPGSGRVFCGSTLKHYTAPNSFDAKVIKSGSRKEGISRETALPGSTVSPALSANDLSTVGYGKLPSTIEHLVLRH
mgnify:CR=1 FL=1